MATFTNLTFDQIEPGTSASVTRRLSVTDVEALALVSGDVDAFHIESGEIPSESLLAAKAVGAEALLSGLISRKLPGPGSAIVSQELRFTGTVSPGDELVTTVTAREKRLDGSVIVFDCSVRRGSEEVISGTMTVAAPTRSVTYTDLATPELILRFNDIFARLLKRCEGLPPVRCGIVHPCDRGALLGTVEAVRHGLIIPVLVGPAPRVRATAAAHGIDIAGWELVDVPHSHAAAEMAVAMARSGSVAALMKGSLHTDEFMSAIVSTTSGLRTDRRISHVFVMDVPSHPRMLLITDAAINIAPDAQAKAEIVQNAIDLAQMLGISEPRVAILAAVEMVHANMPSTVDAAVLCKMADRGQIRGGILDGPLAFDNAVSEVAARAKQIVSPVAGRADILLAPDLDAGNMLAKQLQYLAGADSAGIVLGARVPIMLTSRADSVRGRLASAAVMALVAHARRVQPPRPD